MVNELMDELHIDATKEETATITALIDDAQIMVDSAIGIKSDTVNPLGGTPLYSRAVKTLATQMYYDRSLENGMSKGLIMMLEYLELDREAANETK